MTKSIYADQIERLSKALVSSMSANGEVRLKQSHVAASQVLIWLDYLRKSEATGCCNEMLDGMRAAAVEIAGSIAIGMLRPAMFAMRGQIDLTVGWLFYKDHPLEWEYVLRTGEGFKSRSEIFEFFGKFRDKFGVRLSLLEKCTERTLGDPYRVLSAHIHNQSTLVIPRFKKLDAMVYPEKRCAEAIKLQGEVSEYISDIFLAYFGDKWASLPKQIVTAVNIRVPVEKRSILYS